MKYLFVITLFVTVLALAPAAYADTVKVKDGRTFEGEITQETREYVILRAAYGDLKIPRADIVDIEKSQHTSGQPGKKLTRQEIQKLHIDALELLRYKKYNEAIALYKKIIASDPGDAVAHYNLACTHSLNGEKEAAIDALRASLEAGYTNFRHMKNDSDLDSIRQEESYKELLAKKDQYVAANADKTIEKYKKKLGDEYTYVKDKKYKLVIITNVEKKLLEDLTNALHDYAEAHWKDFFKHKPGSYITVLIPRDSQAYAKDFGGSAGNAGFYVHSTKTLTVNLATGGGTMLHEFTHALHWADMDGLGQGHPVWVIEGFGSLYEQCHRRPDGAYGLLNWRLPVLKKAIADGKCFPLKTFISNSGAYFGRDRGLAYAMSRYIFYFLQEKKLLRKWYARYRRDYARDRTGLKTIEKVYGKSIEKFEKDWLEFLKPLQYGQPAPDPNRPYIGVHLEDTDEGLKISRVAEDTPAQEAGLQTGDTIRKMGDKKIESLSDLHAVVAKHKIGDKVKFIIEREGQEKEIVVKLGKRP